MSFITKNLKKAGIFNTLLICITILIQIYYLIVLYPQGAYFIDFAYSIVMVIALIFGLFYAFSGYKKNGSKYYKLFLLLTLLACIGVVIDDFFYIYSYMFSSMLGTYLAIIRIIPVAILAFAKDFGREKSLMCAYSQFILSLVIFIRGIALYGDFFLQIVQFFGYLLLSIILVIFVEAKYLDKETRGTK